MKPIVNLVLLLWLAHVASAQVQNSYIVSTIGNTCLGVGSDLATLQLFACETSDALLWDVSAEGVVSSHKAPTKCLDSQLSTNANALQVVDCVPGAAIQVWSFNQYGQLKDQQNSGCATILGKGELLNMLVLSPCEGSNKQHFAVSSVSPSLNHSTRTTSKQIPQPVAPQPTAPYSSIPSTEPEVELDIEEIGIGELAAILESELPGMGYLCPCLDSKHEKECRKAIQAACVIGAIPSQACHLSFQQDDHSQVTSSVVALLDKGKLCSALKIAQREESISGEQPKHFLCACLEDLSTPEKLGACSSAMSAACVLGILPSGDCDAVGVQARIDVAIGKVTTSASNYPMPTAHSLRIIQKHSNCGAKAVSTYTQQQQTCPDPPCVDEKTDTPGSKDAFLCSCLDDDHSKECTNAVRKACRIGKIPKQDCLVSLKNPTGVTRHVLHLIDHGALCPDTPTLRFTNGGCHCKHSWTATNGETLKFPNNCADPGGAKGFKWCETVVSESCIGTQDSSLWDRCDKPMHPVYSPGVASGLLVDNSLCSCIGTRPQHEVCRAAIQGACGSGDLPSEVCKEATSTEGTDLPDHIVAAVRSKLRGGAECKTSMIRAWSFSKSQMKDSTASQQICGNHGSMQMNGKCRCQVGFGGKSCTACAKGYFGFPSCKLIRLCIPTCVHGMCDHETGTCFCPNNFSGPDCSQCSPGHLGEQCIPSEYLHVSLYHRHPWLLVFGLTIVVVGSWYLVRTVRNQQLETVVGGVSAGKSEETAKSKTIGVSSERDQVTLKYTGLAI